MEIVHKLVCQSGETYFSFENEQLDPEISHISDEKKLGLLALKHYAIGDYICSDMSRVSIPIGEHRQRVCFGCMRYPLVKVKCREDCPLLTYCSKECLELDTNFLDIYGTPSRYVLDCSYISPNRCLTGKSVHFLHESKSELLDTFLLAFRMVYEYRNRSRNRRNESEHSLNLESFLLTVDNALTYAVDRLFPSESSSDEVRDSGLFSSLPY